MKITVTKSMFAEQFKDMGRVDNFSRAALGALFDYYTDTEESTGEEIELDVVAICCDWTECDSAAEAAREYGWTPDNEEDDNEEKENEAREWLEARTTVLCVGSGVVTQNF